MKIQFIHFGKKEKDKKTVGIAALLVLLMVTAVTGTHVYAKYVRNRYNSGSYRSLNFYFSSDLLTSDGAVYDLNPGTRTLEIILKNTADDLRTAEGDIPYTVAVANAEGSSAAADKTEGTLIKDTADTDTISISGLTNGSVFTVTAAAGGTEPDAKNQGSYVKTLSATFRVLTAEQPYDYVVAQYDGYVELTVWSGGYAGNLQVTVPAGLIPDRTDSTLEAADLQDDGGTFTVEDLAAYESRRYRFFGNAAEADFSVAQETA